MPMAERFEEILPTFRDSIWRQRAGKDGGGKGTGFKLSLRSGAGRCGPLRGRNWRLGDRALRPPFHLGLHDAVFGRHVFVPRQQLLVHRPRHVGQDARPIHNRPLPRLSTTASRAVWKLYGATERTARRSRLTDWSVGRFCFFTLRAYRNTGGSSPRMRGTPLVGAGTLGLERFIPAHAGNTSLWIVNSPLQSVHPRACGEHRIDPADPAETDGSSPRMRGTLCASRRLFGLNRFIPAHAGNTWGGAWQDTRRSVHPRACGEHPHCRTIPPWLGGSSPRMRGTRCARHPE